MLAGTVGDRYLAAAYQRSVFKFIAVINNESGCLGIVRVYRHRLIGDQDRAVCGTAVVVNIIRERGYQRPLQVIMGQCGIQRPPDLRRGLALLFF